MGQAYDEDQASQTIASDADGAAIAVKTEGHAQKVAVLINDDGGGAPADYTLTAEVYDEDQDEWHQKDTTSTTGATGPTYVSHDAVPQKMRFTITNDDAAEQSFHIRVVAHR